LKGDQFLISFLFYKPFYMGRYLTFFILLLIAIAPVFSQDFPLNESGKISFYEVVKADSAKKNLLYHNALKWIYSLRNPDLQMTVLPDSVKGRIDAQNEFSVYSQTGVLKQLSGKITYTSSVEVKDNLYRYTFSNFVFHYYKQDRTYKIVETSKTKALEEPKAAGWQKLWTQHRTTIFKKINADIAQLKILIIEVPVDPKKEQQKKKEIKWDE